MAALKLRRDLICGEVRAGIVYCPRCKHIEKKGFESLPEALSREPRIQKLQEAIEAVVRGKPESIKLALVCLLSQGHLLIEDVPGVGKTTLAHSLAHAFSCTFRRIQFTSDLLPSDILGVSVFNQ